MDRIICPEHRRKNFSCGEGADGLFPGDGRVTFSGHCGDSALIFRRRYRTPDAFDDLLMFGDGECLTGLQFENPSACRGLSSRGTDADSPAFRETERWLDLYFSGRVPGFLPPLRISEATPFRREVLRLILAIPPGCTATYGELAQEIARKRGIARMSAQAVGGAVGWNPVCIIIPCHRVIGADGGLTGYGGGLPNKIALLAHEKRMNAECRGLP